MTKLDLDTHNDGTVSPMTSNNSLAFIKNPNDLKYHSQMVWDEFHIFSAWWNWLQLFCSLVWSLAWNHFRWDFLKHSTRTQWGVKYCKGIIRGLGYLWKNADWFIIMGGSPLLLLLVAHGLIDWPPAMTKDRLLSLPLPRFICNSIDFLFLKDGMWWTCWMGKHSLMLTMNLSISNSLTLN